MRRAILAGLLATAVVTVPGPHDTATASCVGPMLEIGDASRPTVVRGAQLTVTGRYFVDGCNDNPSMDTSGCSAHQVHREPEEPLRDITLSIRQSGRTWTLGTADAGTATDDRLGQVTWTVVLPAGLKPGRAVLVADRAERLRVLVRR